MATTSIAARFSGELSTQRLEDAVRVAEEAGADPSVLVVGTPELERQARAILADQAVGVDRLRASFPRLIVDPQLGDGWNLAAIVDGDLVEASGS